MDKKDAKPVTATAPAKHRSPGYPSTSLSAAIAQARKIYDAEQMHETAPAVAVKHMGYSSLSGPARVALATLKRFGLLSGEANGVKITTDTRKFFLSPSEAEKRELKKKFALSPTLVREIWSECGGQLPSDETIRYRLVTQREFSEESAKVFARVLRETVEFAGLTQTDGSPADDQPVDEVLAAAEVDDATRTAGRHEKRGDLRGTSSRATNESGLVRFQLSDGNCVELHSDNPLTAETIDELKAYLEVYERVLKKQAASSAFQGGDHTK